MCLRSRAGHRTATKRVRLAPITTPIDQATTFADNSHVFCRQLSRAARTLLFLADTESRPSSHQPADRPVTSENLTHGNRTAPILHNLRSISSSNSPNGGALERQKTENFPFFLPSLPNRHRPRRARRIERPPPNGQPIRYSRSCRKMGLAQPIRA